MLLVVDTLFFSFIKIHKTLAPGYGTNTYCTNYLRQTLMEKQETKMMVQSHLVLGEEVFNLGTLNVEVNNFGVSDMGLASSFFLFELLLPFSFSF